MQVTRKSRLNIRLQNIVFVLIFLSALAMVAWLSTRYAYQADWTLAGSNTLSPASQSLLAKVDKPLLMTSYARNTEGLRNSIRDLVSRYQRVKPDIELVFVNPDAEPELVRTLGITLDGEIILVYDGRSEAVKELNEINLSNAIQAISRPIKPKVVFLEGHGERGLQETAGRDLTNWAKQLISKGFVVSTINLGRQAKLPANTKVLVVAGLQSDLLPGEAKVIEEHLKSGGNFLWLADPGPLHGMDPVAKYLGAELQIGTLADPNAQAFGAENAGFTVISEYNLNPVTTGFSSQTLFPQAVSVRLAPPQGWTGLNPFLETPASSWVELGPMIGDLKQDGPDIPGPHQLGVNMTRRDPEVLAQVDKAQNKLEQRVAIVGDGDFLSNAYLGVGGNLALGFNIINWLSNDDKLITLPARSTEDTTLLLTPNTMSIISIGFLVALPILLLLTGMVIWLRRRKR